MSDTKKILTDARKLIAEPEQWTKGCFARNAAGDWALLNSELAVCWCLEGAIRYSAKKYAPKAWVIPSYEAKCAVENHLGRPVVGFNDNPERTHAEVLESLDTVIAGL